MDPGRWMNASCRGTDSYGRIHGEIRSYLKSSQSDRSSRDTVSKVRTANVVFTQEERVGGAAAAKACQVTPNASSKSDIMSQIGTCATFSGPSILPIPTPAGPWMFNHGLVRP